ncbi:cystatin-1-like [Amphibalanus amphitrite]|uniref:cystatin-1-like n=1 Tax=Amphibalanus amphitrite TaxID=1232801 RepID=UPI001C9018C2|nr:cystatin-1-like [Amphibalanus amphitrite]
MKTVVFVVTLQALCTMAQLAGGWSKKPVDDEQVKTMALFAVPHVQGEINHSNFFKLSSIDDVEAQVVSGMNYRITMTLEQTTSDKAAATQEDCEHQTASPAGKVQCTVVVYDQPWTGKREVTSKSCGEVQY